MVMMTLTSTTLTLFQTYLGTYSLLSTVYLR